jgi:hypothetical protein
VQSAIQLPIEEFAERERRRTCEKVTHYHAAETPPFAAVPDIEVVGLEDDNADQL